MNTATALQQVNEAQENLDTLLSKGEDTMEARRVLKDAEYKLTLVKQDENQKLSASESRKKSARQLEAGEIIASVTSELDKTIESLLNNIQAPVLNIPLYLAENILIAHERLTTAQEKQREQDSGVIELRQRQTELQAKRQKVIQRRSNGQTNDEEDSRALVLIDADLEGLTALIDKKVNSAEAVDTTQQERTVAEAQIALSSAINASYIECLRSLITQLEPSLVATAQTLAAAPGIIAKNRWSPCPVIKEACQNGIF